MSTLYLCTLPIGRDTDITVSVINAIKDVDIIVCEDTRVVKNCLSRIGLDFSNKKFLSFHDHSADGDLSKIRSLLDKDDIIYASDAGSPIISDPALKLVELAYSEGYNVESLSGVSSVICALELCALPITPFHFHGFLARDKSKLNSFIDNVQSQYGTHLFFEGVSRVEATLEYLSSKLPQMKFVIARELTKTHQSVHRFIGQDFSSIKNELTFKGEFVILIYNDSKKQVASSDISKLANAVLEKKGKSKELSKLLASILDRDAKEIYKELSH